MTVYRGQEKLQGKGFRWGLCQFVSIFLTLFFLAFGILFLWLKQNDSLSIHSCNIYVPSKLTALWAILESVSAYVQRHGWSELVSDFSSVVRGEVLGLAPYPHLRAAVEGKHLLMVGGARSSTALARARQLGIRLTLVDDSKMAYTDSWEQAGVRGVETFIPIDNFGHASVRQPEAILRAVVDALSTCKASAKEGGSNECEPTSYDGVFTLVEDHGPLVSYIAEELRLVASPHNVSTIARNKFQVRQAMDRANLTIPRYALIHSREDLESAADKVGGFPAFLKPVYGVQATFAARVSDMGELERTYERFQTDIDEEHHPIYHYGKEMILEELMGGAEVQLEIMLQNGEIVYHCFSSSYSAMRDTLHFPMILGEAEKKELLEAAANMLSAVGLSQGVVHIELFLDPKLGAQVIEVNNRLSRGFLAHSMLHQIAFGEKAADYWGSVFALALGVPPAFTQRTSAPIHMALFLDKPSTEWWKTEGKDAPNRGWEAEGGCGVFFGASPQAAYEAGLTFRREKLKEFKGAVVDRDDFLIGLILWGCIVSSIRLFFL